MLTWHLVTETALGVATAYAGARVLMAQDSEENIMKLAGAGAVTVGGLLLFNAFNILRA